jgi:hypothetical protein
MQVILGKKISRIYWVALFLFLSGCSQGEDRGWLGKGPVAENVPLTFRHAGSGAGNISVNLSGMDCGTTSTCVDYPFNTTVTLTAMPSTDSVFAGWEGGGCTGTAVTCTVTMDTVKEVTAAFALKTFTLVLSASGSGAGTVSSDIPGISCGTICMATYTINQSVILTAMPSADSVFTGWEGGGCTGLSVVCTIKMDTDKTITTAFTKTFTLTVVSAGSGTVTSNPSGIDCGVSCKATYLEGDVVTLTATPATGGFFRNWAGDCVGTTTDCVLTMNADKAVQAQFDLTFAPAARFTVSTTARPDSLAINDLNGDGRLDIVTTDTDGEGSFSVFIGNGSAGLLDSPTTFPMALAPRGVVIFDFNQDGKADVATANEGADNVAVRLGNGVGSFGAATFFPVGNGPRSLVTADVDGDARPDVVTANLDSQDVSVLLNRDNTNLFEPVSDFSIATSTYSAAVGDLNKDGKMDIVGANAFANPSDPLLHNTITILLGDGTGNFSDEGEFPIAGTDPFSVILVDVNNDGNLDAVTANRMSNTVSVLLGNGLCVVGDCTFGAATNFPVASVPKSPLFVAAGDLNHDGQIDLVTANRSGHDVSVLLGDGTGFFQSALLFSVGALTGPRSVAIADLNGDGKNDLMTANSTSRDITILLGR